MTKAFIFPGQGSQKVGMGKDFFDSFPVAKDTFQAVDEVLKLNLSNIIFNDPDEELALTVNTQPALMTVSIAILNVIIQQSGKKINELCSYVAGHSLGEYSALAAAEAISLEDTAKLLQIRGKSMQNACPQGQGAMAACIGIEHQKLQKLLGDAITEGVCQIANDNVEGQIVISGHNENIDKIVAILKDTGFRAIKLNVSAPFHSDLIKDAEKNMSTALKQTTINKLIVPLIANVTADVSSSLEDIENNLIKQICGQVRWRETMDKFAALGVDELVEIGSGKVLSGLAKKSKHDFKISNVSNVSELDSFLENL